MFLNIQNKALLISFIYTLLGAEARGINLMGSDLINYLPVLQV